jgi:hypothetical protein
MGMGPLIGMDGETCTTSGDRRPADLAGGGWRWVAAETRANATSQAYFKYTQATIHADAL